MRNRLYISGFLLDIGGTKNCCYYGKKLCEMIIKKCSVKKFKKKKCKYTSQERERGKKKSNFKNRLLVKRKKFISDFTFSTIFHIFSALFDSHLALGSPPPIAIKGLDPKSLNTFFSESRIYAYCILKGWTSMFFYTFFINGSIIIKLFCRMWIVISNFIYFIYSSTYWYYSM